MGECSALAIGCSKHSPTIDLVVGSTLSKRLADGANVRGSGACHECGPAWRASLDEGPDGVP